MGDHLSPVSASLTPPFSSIARSNSALAALAAIPEESVWLASQKSPQTRRAYRTDVSRFFEQFGITASDQLISVDHKAVIAWEQMMRETERLEAATVRRRLSALSSLFKHLLRHGVVEQNPVADIRRPNINRREGRTPAFSTRQARAILDAPSTDSLVGLRDRAILSVGFQAGLRRAEIAALKVNSLHQNRGFDSLHVTRKGGRKDSLAIHPQCAQRIRSYLEVAGHGDDLKGPLFRPSRNNRFRRDENRGICPDTGDRILRRYARTIGIETGYSAHSMRATFITIALDNGASLEDVQRAAGHADPATTKLYDRRGYDPEKSASFFASY